MNSKNISEGKKLGLLHIIGGAIVSISVTLVLILLFAVFIRYFNIKDNFIFPVNQIIKIISIIIFCFILLKKHVSHGFIKGIILGIVYFVLSYLIFSILQGYFSFDIKNLYDFILTTIMGGLIGIILVNIIKK